MRSAPPRPRRRWGRCRSGAGPWRSPPSTAWRHTGRCRGPRWTMQACAVVAGNTAFTLSGRSFSPSQTRKKTSRTPRFLMSVSRLIQNFADAPPPVPATAPARRGGPPGRPDRGVERLVTHPAVPNLDVDRVDEHRRMHRQQRPRGPGRHVLQHPVGDARHGVLGHRRAVHLGEVRADLPGRQSLPHRATAPPRRHRTAGAAAWPR